MILVSIHRGPLLLEERRLSRTRLPDGRDGALWRGLAFPLRPPGNVIDVDDEGHAPAPPGPPPRASYAVVEGGEEGYVLLAGSGTALEEAALALRGGGVEVLRTGRYLGDPVEGVEADWFVRVVAATDLRERVAGLLGTPGAEPPGTDGLRIRLLTAELAVARAREASALGEVARLRAAAAVPTRETPPVPRPEAETEGRVAGPPVAPPEHAPALLAPEEAEATIEPPARANPERRGRRGLESEIGDVVRAFLPRLGLLRDSLGVVAAEFADRRGLYRALGELQGATDGTPPGWKTLQGVPRWIEHHVSNGQDDTGRAYARLDPGEGRWSVLVSHKGQQGRDVRWLARR